MIEVDPSDPVRTYTEAEEKRLALQLRALNADVHAGSFRNCAFDPAWLCECHRRLFDGVRDHAGRTRRRDYGDERLTFGPNRSAKRDEVPELLENVFRKLRRTIESFKANPDAPQYEEHAIRVAVWAHAEVIRIHPYMDGNGRSSRVLMNSILVELGLLPVAVDVVKHEYNEALNHYFRAD